MTLISSRDECISYFDSFSEIYTEIVILSEKIANLDDLSKTLNINIMVIKEDEEEKKSTISLINPKILMFDEIIFVYIKDEYFYSAVPKQKSIQETISSYINECFFKVIYNLANTKAYSRSYIKGEKEILDTCEKIRTLNNAFAKSAKNLIIKSLNHSVYQKVILDIDYSKII